MATERLESFPRPGVAVDLAILTVAGVATADPELRVLIQRRSDPDGDVLPGAFIRERKTVVDTVSDIFGRKVGVRPGRDVTPRLLRLFDEPDRDERTWVISAGYSVSMPECELGAARGVLAAVRDDGRVAIGSPLLFGHDEIVEDAVKSLRERYEFRHRYADTLPDPDGFLTEAFTLHRLRKVHEAVVGQLMHKDNFNRRMKPYLEPVVDESGSPLLAENLRGRPAVLYRRLGEV